MAGLNNIREAYSQVYNQLDERMSDDEKEMRRLAAQERRAGKSDRTDAKAASKYAESEKKSAEREDKKSRGKHIHGMADSVEVDGDLVDEGMTMKDFKANRKKAKASAARADAVKRGHVGKEWYNSGRRYSPDEAKRSRANMDDEERRTRHRSAVDPDNEDDNNYSADKTKNPKKLRKQKAMGESAVPGKPAEKLGAVTAIPKSEQEAARERLLAKAKAMREKNMKKEEAELEEKRGLWDNIHAKRKRGERPAKPGEKGYPKTLNVEEVRALVEGIKQARKNVGASKCWTGKKLGNPSTKMKGGKEVPNCVPEALVYGGEKKEPEDKRMTVTAADKKANTKAWQKYKAGNPAYKAAAHVGEETVVERALDTAETGEKERLVKGMKKSAADFKKRYGERAKSVMYATATKMAKKHMDTSKSDRRYAVEETSMEENADLENRKKGPRKPSQMAKREKLNKLIDEIRTKREGESK